MDSVRWGVLSTAKIGRKKVIPAMQQGQYSEIVAIASRSRERSKAVADALGISRAFGSYEDLLAESDVDAVYIPLPNHLHVPWILKALEAGKHVLCEKPIGLSASEAETVAEAARSYPQLKVMEAFMYRLHPQWEHAKALIEDGKIGELKAVQSSFSYFNVDPDNIRNQAEAGGGGLMDIGCYCISLARFLFGAEPRRVVADMETDPEFGTDYLTSGILDFGTGTSTFTCSTQSARYQRVSALGASGTVEIEIPFNAPPDEPTRIWVSLEGERKEVTFDAANQYTLQGDRFSRAILDDAEVPTPLDDAVANMRVIDSVRRSAESGSWVEV